MSKSRTGFENRMIRFLSDKYILVPIFFTVAFLAMSYGIVFVKLAPLGDNIILRLNLERKIDFYANYLQIYQIFFGFVIFCLIDAFFSFFLYFRERILSYIFIYSALFLSVISAIAFYVIDLLN